MYFFISVYVGVLSYASALRSIILYNNLTMMHFTVFIFLTACRALSSFLNFLLRF